MYAAEFEDAAARDELMTSQRAISSSNMSIETTFTRLRPNDEYNISIAVNMRYGLAKAISIAATTTREFLVRI